MVTVPRMEPVLLVKPTPNAGMVVPLAMQPNDRLVEAAAPYEPIAPEFPLPVSTFNFTTVEPLPTTRVACHAASFVEMAASAPCIVIAPVPVISVAEPLDGSMSKDWL